MTLSALEKDAFDGGQDAAPVGHTQFGFKGAGDSRTLYAEGDRQAGQRKLMFALGAVGVLILVLALGGLFVYLRSTAAPEIPSRTAAENGESASDDLSAEADTGSGIHGIGHPGCCRLRSRHCRRGHRRSGCVRDDPADRRWPALHGRGNRG